MLRKDLEIIMKAFFKQHSFDMVKLFLNQIAMTVFATMLTLAAVKNKNLALAVSIFSVLFYLFINYSAVWELGAKDKLRVDAGRMAPMPAKGFFIALGAALPNIFLTILIGVGLLFDTAGGQKISLYCNVIMRLVNGTYLGIIDSIESALFANNARLADIWWWFFVINVPAIFTAWLAYLLGSKNISIASVLGIKPKVNAKKKN